MDGVLINKKKKILLDFIDFNITSYSETLGVVSASFCPLQVLLIIHLFKSF